MFVERGAGPRRPISTGWAVKGSRYVCNLGRRGSHRWWRLRRRLVEKCFQVGIHAHAVITRCTHSRPVVCVRGPRLIYCQASARLWAALSRSVLGLWRGTALFCHFLTVPLLCTLSIKHTEFLCPFSGPLPSSSLPFVFRGDRSRLSLWRWPKITYCCISHSGTDWSPVLLSHVTHFHKLFIHAKFLACPHSDWLDCHETLVSYCPSVPIISL